MSEGGGGHSQSVGPTCCQMSQQKLEAETTQQDPQK